MPSDEYYLQLAQTIGGLQRAFENSTEAVRNLTAYTERKLQELAERTERQSNEWRQAIDIVKDREIAELRQDIEELRESHLERIEKLEKWQKYVLGFTSAVTMGVGYTLKWFGKY